MNERRFCDVLLLIPCCASKKGTGPRPRLSSAPWPDELSPSALAALEEGRRVARARWPDHFDSGSAFLPAMTWYTGIAYSWPGFRGSLDSAFEGGMRCLIVSAGYGLLRPDDLIQDYDLQMGRVSGIWKERLPKVLADYVSRNDIERVFGVLSDTYYQTVVGVERMLPKVHISWHVPFSRSLAGSGSAVQKVSGAIGETVTKLVGQNFESGEIRPIRGAFADSASAGALVAGQEPERKRRSPVNIEEVWARIEAHQDQEFHQIRGQGFRYVVKGSYLTPNTTRQNIPKSAFEQALSLVPLQNTTKIQHLRGPSYIFAILMDDRIRRADW